MWGMSDERQRAEWRAQGVAPLDYPFAVAEDWPDLIWIVRERVKAGPRSPEPQGAPCSLVAVRRERPGLYAAIANLERVLVSPQTSTHRVFAFLTNGMVTIKH